MADHDTPSSQPDGSGADRNGSRFHRSRKYLKFGLAAAIGAAVALGSLGVVKAVVGSHWSDGRFIGFVEHRLDHVLDRLDVTDAQRDRITPVITNASRELERLYFDMKASRPAFVAALTGEAVDHGALETLRGERIAALDTASRAAIGALADAVAALTPEQRQRLGERLERRMRHH